MFFFVVCLLLALPGLSGATSEETLPAYHWSYPLIDRLRLHGYFAGLFTSHRPFTRGTIAHALADIQTDRSAGRLTPSPSDAWLLDRLNAEFSDEHAERQDSTSYRLKLGITGALDGLYRSPDLAGSNLMHYGVLNAGSRAREGLRTKISAGYGERLTLFYALRLDRNLVDDPTYIGKYFRGVTGYTEQAYVQARHGPVRFKIGRDFLVLGAGKNGRLLMSDNSRPFDLYQAEITASFVRFTAFGIQLDDLAQDSLFTPGIGPANTARRYINGHRFDFRIGSRAMIGVSELVVYGGPKRTFELAYVNPGNFYHGETLNDETALGRPANTIGSVDVSVFPARGLEVYWEVLIDDIKIEKVNVSDLEPPRFGLLAGARYADPLRLDGVTLRGEYTRIANRTFNVYFNDWERYLHRNRPIGHYLGNNFDRFLFGADVWGTRSLHLSAEFEYLRQGRDSIDSPYNVDYLNVPSVDQGYSEPFPFGPVQRTHAMNLSVVFSPHHDIRFQTDLRLARVRNFAFTGLDRNQVQLFRVGVSVNYDLIRAWR